MIVLFVVNSGKRLNVRTNPLTWTMSLPVVCSRLTILFCCWCFFYFWHQLLDVSCPIIARLYHMLGGDLNLVEIGSEIWGPSLSHKKMAAPKRHNFGAIYSNFTTWLRISLERNKLSSIGKWCRKLRPLQHLLAHLIWQTLVHKWPLVSTHPESTYSDAPISGDKGWLPLKNFTSVQRTLKP